MPILSGHPEAAVQERLREHANAKGTRLFSPRKIFGYVVLMWQFGCLLDNSECFMIVFNVVHTFVHNLKPLRSYLHDVGVR